ncbi:MAG: hypothetical protein HZA50_00960 [Planctomycetes bacterium]|nr:hypothetical protein [Planctomycetota bacterium]
MTETNNDVKVLRELAKQYAEIASKPVQEERRRLWAAHFSLKPTRPLVLTTYGMWNVWCREVFGDGQMACRDAFCRNYERTLRRLIFQDEVGDDSIAEPWIGMSARVKGQWGQLWGVKSELSDKPIEGGAAHFDPPIKDWKDPDKLRATPHEVDEKETAANASRLRDALGDILTVDVVRTPCYSDFMADISTSLARLRGLEQIMMDMYDFPQEMHRLLAFMRDSILANNRQAEQAGHYSLTSSQNQAMPYSEQLERPAANSGPRKRKDIWGFCAAQEYTLVSPAFHEEFLLNYQIPIYEHFGLVHYGCCEDLTKKIDMLRKMKNLRSIAVTPVANVRKCAEQIGRDFAISWRPNPTDMVCAAWDEARVRRIIREGLEACRGQFLHLHLKDIETVQGDTGRLARWTKIVRQTIDEYWR